MSLPSRWSSVLKSSSIVVGCLVIVLGSAIFAAERSYATGPVAWAVSTGPSDLNDVGNPIVAPNGDVYDSSCGTAGSGVPQLLALDASGNTLWSIPDTYKYALFSSCGDFNDVAFDSGGNFYAIAQTSTSPPQGDFLLSFSSQGNLNWAQSITGVNGNSDLHISVYAGVIYVSDGDSVSSFNLSGASAGPPLTLPGAVTYLATYTRGLAIATATDAYYYDFSGNLTHDYPFPSALTNGNGHFYSSGAGGTFFAAASAGPNSTSCLPLNGQSTSLSKITPQSGIAWTYVATPPTNGCAGGIQLAATPSGGVIANFDKQGDTTTATLSAGAPENPISAFSSSGTWEWTNYVPADIYVGLTTIPQAIRQIHVDTNGSVLVSQFIDLGDCQSGADASACQGVYLADYLSDGTSAWAPLTIGNAGASPDCYDPGELYIDVGISPGVLYLTDGHEPGCNGYESEIRAVPVSIGQDYQQYLSFGSPSAPSQPGGPYYVAFGDSLTTGFSVAACNYDLEFSPWGCQGTPPATPYPDLVAKALGYSYSDSVSPYEAAAPSLPSYGLARVGIWGQTVAAAVSDTGPSASDPWEPQLSAIPKAKKLVTGELGINDMNFDNLSQWLPLYRADTNDGGKRVVDHAQQLLSGISSQLVDLFATLTQAKQNGATVVVTLPYNPYSSNALGCNDANALAGEIVDTFDDAIAQRASNAGLKIADFRPVFDGHGDGDKSSFVFGTQCTTVRAIYDTYAPSWVGGAGQNTAVEFDPHPNNLGTAAMAKSVLQAIGE